MLISKILRSKLQFIKSNGDTLIDLISSTFDFNKGGTSNAGLIRVSEDEIMRPDLISTRIYTESSKWDILLKYNGISNPFSIFLFCVFKLNETIFGTKSFPNKKHTKIKSFINFFSSFNILSSVCLSPSSAIRYISS